VVFFGKRSADLLKERLFFGKNCQLIAIFRRLNVSQSRNRQADNLIKIRGTVARPAHRLVATTQDPLRARATKNGADQLGRAVFSTDPFRR
jgi:hypothetical protein